MGQLVEPREGDKITYEHVPEEARERGNGEAVHKFKVAASTYNPSA